MFESVRGKQGRQAELEQGMGELENKSRLWQNCDMLIYMSIYLCIYLVILQLILFSKNITVTTQLACLLRFIFITILCI